MLDLNNGLLSEEFVSALASGQLDQGGGSFPALGAGQIYLSEKDAVAGLVTGSMFNFGEFTATPTELEEAKTRQAALTTPLAVYDTVTGNKHVYSSLSASWAIDTTTSLWNDYPVGVMLHNPATKKSFFYMYVGSVVKV